MKRTSSHSRSVWIGIVSVGLMASGEANASLTRNAAGSKNMGEAGVLTIDTAGQREREPDGKAWTLETGIQYQVSGRLQFLVEAMPFELQQPDSGTNASGAGDTDLTFSWLAFAGNRLLPTLVFGASVKLPTAGREIGSAKADYASLLVLGKEVGELELGLETEFVKFGQPRDRSLKDQFVYTLTAEYALNDFLAVYGEVFGNSAPTAAESRTDAARVGLEVDFPLRGPAAPYVSLEVDTEGVSAARAGIEWTW